MDFHQFYFTFILQNLMAMHPGGGGNVNEGSKKSSKKAKFRTSSNSSSVLAPIHQVSISSTFYARIFCTKVLFSSYILAKKHFRTKNASVKCWCNWLQEMETNPDLIPKHGKSILLRFETPKPSIKDSHLFLSSYLWYTMQYTHYHLLSFECIIQIFVNE